MLALTDKTATYDGCTAGRFDIVCEPAAPLAYAIPAQAGRR